MRLSSRLKSLNSLSVELSLLVFQDIFDFLAFSFDKITIDELDHWISELKDPTIDDLWLRQKEMKRPSFIIYFVMWHFRNKTLQKREYSRELFEKDLTSLTNSTTANGLLDGLKQDISELSPFEGIEALGRLIGKWMLSCPKEIILNDPNLSADLQPDQGWIAHIFPGTLKNDFSIDELNLLYRLDYRLYYTFADIEAHNF